MTDPLPVAELEPGSASKGPIPFLWLAIVMLLTGASAALFSGAADDEPAMTEGRLAAATGTATAVDFAFSATSTFDGVEVGDEVVPSFTLVGAYDAETRRVRMSMDAIVQSMEIIQDDGIQYLHATGEEPLGVGSGTKPWLRMDLRHLSTGESAETPFASNPLDTFARLGEITSPIVRVGEETVRGVPTVHYRTTVDRSKRAYPTRRPEQVAAMRNVLVEVWLDADDLPRRNRQTMQIDAATATKATIVTTFESYDFGKAVSIELPPEDQVEDFDPAALRSTLEELTKPRD